MAEDKKVTQSEKSPEEEKTEAVEETAAEEKAAETPEEKAEEPKTEAEPEDKPIKQEPAESAPEGGEAPAVTKPEDLKKPLDKMTAKELRDVALGIPGITGVHAMKKEQLLATITEAWGIKDEKAPKKEKKGKPSAGVAELKARIREIKAKRAEALQKKDKRMAKIYRRQINRLKKRTRRAA